MTNLSRFIKALFIFTLIFAFGANSVLATNHIEKKRKETHAKVVKFKMLESMETNKLYKNQRKLERSEENLKKNKKQYSTAEERLSEAERELAQVQTDLVQAQFKARNRVRQIFKKQRRGMFQLLLSTTDMNTFLDRIYFQNVITKKDKKRLAYLKAKTERARALRNQIEQQKSIIAYSIKNINSEQRDIQ